MKLHSTGSGVFWKACARFCDGIRHKCFESLKRSDDGFPGVTGGARVFVRGTPDLTALGKVIGGAYR